MQNSSPTIPSFVSCAQVLIPTFHYYLSGNFHDKIAISTSLMINKPLIVLPAETGTDFITVEDFLALLDVRIKKEFFYREEILQMRNNIYEEFNELCDGIIDQDFIKFVRTQRQKIIDTLFSETKIDDKMIIEKFFNNITNGFEDEALNLNNFDEIAHNVLWQPLLTPLPIGVLDEGKILIKEAKNDKSCQRIESIANKLVEYIKKYMKAVKIKDSKFDTKEKLNLALEELTKKRQICEMKINKVVTNQDIIGSFREKCVATVQIIIDTEKFLTSEIKIYYEELILEHTVERADVENVFNKIQKPVKRLDVRFGEGNLKHYKKIGASLMSLKWLSNLNINLSWNYMEAKEAEALLLGFKSLGNISTLSLNLKNNVIGSKGAKAISDVLKNLKFISTLNLNLAGNKIKTEGTNAILTTLKELNNISILSLDLQESNVKEEETKALSSVLMELNKILILNLNLAENSIKVEGVKSISSALIKLNNISKLSLNFEENSIQAEGATILSAALGKLKNISMLNLNLAKNNIGSEGAKALSVALKELNNISSLSLNIRYNNLKTEETKIISAALLEIKYISCLHLNLGRNEIGAEGAEKVLTILKDLKHMLSLDLDLAETDIKTEDLNLILVALRGLAMVSNVKINLSHNKIEVDGRAAIELLKVDMPNIEINYNQMKDHIITICKKLNNNNF